MLSSVPAAPPPVAAPRRAIIGRGCDPVRARFAEQHFRARLGVDVDCATSDAELWEKMGKRQYELFFLARLARLLRGSCVSLLQLLAADCVARAQAPGACHLTRVGAYGGGDVVSRVRELQARLLRFRLAPPARTHVPHTAAAHQGRDDGRRGPWAGANSEGARPCGCARRPTEHRGLAVR